MSSKSGRGAKVAQKSKQTPWHNKDELCSINTEGFLAGLQSNDGHPLHSTALEEDLQPSEADSTKTAKKTKGAAVKRKEPEGEEEKENAGKRRKSEKVKGKLSPDEVKQTKPGEKKKSRQQSEKPRKSRAQEDGLHAGATRQRRRSLPSSDEDLEDSDQAWTPGSKKTKVFGSSRKPSSGQSTSAESPPGIQPAGAGKAKMGEPMRKQRCQKAATELDVLLDAFHDFSSEYRESVESKAIQHSIDDFISSVKEQLVEQISSYKELSTLKRESAKKASQTHTKSKTLLSAKNELMRAQGKRQQLQKERARLKLRLADLQRGHALLQDIRGLQRQYLDFRRSHSKARETYGASSLPALMLEAAHVKSAEQQLKGINARLENRLKKEGK